MPSRLGSRSTIKTHVRTLSVLGGLRAGGPQPASIQALRPRDKSQQWQLRCSPSANPCRTMPPSSSVACRSDMQHAATRRCLQPQLFCLSPPASTSRGSRLLSAQRKRRASRACNGDMAASRRSHSLMSSQTSVTQRAAMTWMPVASGSMPSG